jgi:long-chain fatty acid transport protein
MATAFVAVADDPSTIMHNPAGLINLQGFNIYGGGTAMVPSTEFKSPSGASEKAKSQVFFPPHFFATYDLNTDNLCLGLGVYSPFGIGGTRWSEDGLTRYASTKSLISTVAVNPAMAWRVQPWLSVAAGFFYLGAYSNTEQMVNQSALGAPDGKSSIKGYGGGWGYNLGILLFPGEKLSFGASYRSHCEVDQKLTLSLEDIALPLRPLFGGSSFKTTVYSSLNFPQALNFGFAFRPTSKLTLSLEAEWMGWTSFDKMNLDLVSQVPEARVTSTSIPLNWHDIWLAKIGVEYKVTDKLALRGGYAHIQNPVPERTLNPGNPDSDQHVVTTGFGATLGRITVDTFYHGQFYENRTVENEILSGRYSTIVHSVGMSLGYRF